MAGFEVFTEVWAPKEWFVMSIRVDGEMVMHHHDFAGAEESLSEQVQVAKQASLPSIEADGLLHLSQIYRSQGNGAKAELAIDKGACVRISLCCSVCDHAAARLEAVKLSITTPMEQRAD